jgi:hypothetical protein
VEELGRVADRVLAADTEVDDFPDGGDGGTGAGLSFADLAGLEPRLGELDADARRAARAGRRDPGWCPVAC